MNNPQWLEWAQRLQGISQTGLTYCKDHFDKERYEAIQEIAAEIMAKGAGVEDISVIHGLFKGQAGCHAQSRYSRGRLRPGPDTARA